jgi:hypothetical protein
MDQDREFVDFLKKFKRDYPSVVVTRELEKIMEFTFYQGALVKAEQILASMNPFIKKG